METKIDSNKRKKIKNNYKQKCSKTNINNENNGTINGKNKKLENDSKLHKESTKHNLPISLVKDNFTYSCIRKVLLIFAILGPIFDIASFIFRNRFHTKISISTFLRPIIPICVALYIFCTANKKNKKKFVNIACVYLLYAVCHILITKKLFTGCSDGTIINEIQYICNFTFLIIDLIIYIYTFIYEGIILKKEDYSRIYTKKNNEKTKSKNKLNINQLINNENTNKKISNSILIMVAIYLITIAISIITKTSSFTYIETNTGYKGLVESGNSLSAILVVSLFIMLPNIELANWKRKLTQIKIFEIFKILIAICDFVYLTTTIGTRTGLIGAFLAIFCYIIVESVFSKNKKIMYIGFIFMIIGVVAISTFGSKTIKRRAQMKQSQFAIIDKSTGEIGNMTGDMLDIKNKILDGTIESSFMNDAQKQATIDLYNYAKAHNIAGNDTRKQQLIYNLYLVKHQKNLLYILFGNGFKTNFREMVMENELASILLNFGIIGFVLYVMPLLVILIISTKNIINKIIKLYKNNKERKSNKNLVNIRKEIENTEIKSKLKKQTMYQLALGLVIALSWFSGYVLFASSCMIVISIVATLNLMSNLYGLNSIYKLNERQKKEVHLYE